MVEEDDASGRVAAVYAAVLEQAPFVPSLLKSLALCPPYLVLAWRQAAPVLSSAELPQAVQRLVREVEDAATPPQEPGARDLLGSFAEPIGRMLLLSCGLRAALKGELGDLPPAMPEVLAQPRVSLDRPVPSLGELPEHAKAFGRIRAALGTPIVNSIWRQAAADGWLETIWDHLEPQAAPSRLRADDLLRTASAGIGGLPWDVAADSASLRAADIADAAPGVIVVLDAYASTLARVLTLVACCGHRPPA